MVLDGLLTIGGRHEYRGAALHGRKILMDVRQIGGWDVWIRKKAKPTNRGKEEEERYIEREEKKAMWGYFASGKEESDRQAKRGDR